MYPTTKSPDVILVAGAWNVLNPPTEGMVVSRMDTEPAERGEAADHTWKYIVEKRRALPS
jgi:hypothetical protein